MFTRLTPSAIGRFSLHRPRLAICLWLAFVIGAALALSLTGTKQLQSGAAGESARANAVLNAHPLGVAPREYVYLHSATLGLDTPGFAAAIARAGAELRRALGNPVTVSRSADGHAALLTAQVAAPFDATQLRRRLAADSRTGGAIAAVLGGGQLAAGNDLSRAERLSVPVTLLVLLLVFGALVAAAVPVALALTAVVAAFGLLGPISQAFPLDDSVKTVVLLIGMAVGVDYALFYVVRAREERRRGLDAEAALRRTAHTSGRSVIIAGSAVMIAMGAQFAVGSAVFNGIAAGTIVVVACAVAGSVTVLPALLALLGDRIERGRIRWLPHLRTEGESRLWGAIVTRVLRRPWLAGGAATALLIALALPALGMRVSKPSSDALSAAGQSTQVAQITSDFPGTSSPAMVVVSWSGRPAPGLPAAVARLERAAGARGLAHPPFTVAVSPDHQALALALPLTGLGDNAASRHAVAALRQTLIPATLGRVPGVSSAVTGATAEDVDFTAQMTRGIPYVVGLVLALAFVVLLVAFRSLVVPIKAIALNLLSVGAAYGVLVLVFEHRWAQGLLGFHSNGTIVSWLPLFLFVVLFGLSMDYHVFILGRVREGVDAGLSTEMALARGISATAGVVNGAALVMVAVFALFATATSLDLKQAGIGLAAAVLIDASVIRGVLLPATMKLLGDANWYLPAWLRWLEGLSSSPPEPGSARVIGDSPSVASAARIPS